MDRNRLVLLLVVCALMFYGSRVTACGTCSDATTTPTPLLTSSMCGAGLYSCGNACYDVSMYMCYSNSTLCPKNMQMCGSVGAPQCYDPTLYTCVQNSGGQEMLVSKSLLVCNGVGYDPNMYLCIDNTLSDIPNINSNCSVGQINCGGQCADPMMYQCVSGQLKALPGVCGAGLLWCSTQCFDPSQYNCINNTLLQACDNVTHTCPSQQQQCGDAGCYDPSLYVCYQGNVICGVGMQVCGCGCYDNNRYMCMNGTTIVGRPGYCSPQYSLCGSTCYDASKYTCNMGILVPTTSGFSCANSSCITNYTCCADVMMGSVCISPNTHECVNSNQVCASGLKTCGNICYDPNVYTCIANNSQNYRLCPCGFEVCGTSQCYDSTKFACVGSGGVLSPVGAPVCGGLAYNSTKYSCVGSGLTLTNSSTNNNNNTNHNNSTDSGSSSESGSSSDSSSSSESSGDESGSSSDENVVCLTGQQKCAGVCFSPDTHACLNHVVVIICDITMNLCGANACYDPNTQNCVNKTVVNRLNCTSDNKLCGIQNGPVYCYDPDNYKCVNGSVSPLVTCTASQNLCGSTCYDVSLYECIDNLIVSLNTSCNSSTITCGNYTRCFDPNLYLCSAGVLTCINLCGGNTCYDSSVSQCIQGIVTPYISCASGQTRCGPPSLGLCYLTTQYQCINNTLQCLAGWPTCGSHNLCYNPQTSSCENGNVTTLTYANGGARVVGGVRVDGVVVLVAAMVALLSLFV